MLFVIVNFPFWSIVSLEMVVQYVRMLQHNCTSQWPGWCRGNNILFYLDCAGLCTVMITVSRQILCQDCTLTIMTLFFTAVTFLLYMTISHLIYCCVTSTVDTAVLHNLIINYCSVYLVGFTTDNNYWRDNTVNRN
jgi:hypothetical protein